MMERQPRTMKIPLGPPLPAFGRKKIPKGDITPPFGKGRLGGILQTYFPINFQYGHPITLSPYHPITLCGFSDDFIKRIFDDPHGSPL